MQGPGLREKNRGEGRGLVDRQLLDVNLGHAHFMLQGLFNYLLLL